MLRQEISKPMINTVKKRRQKLAEEWGSPIEGGTERERRKKTRLEERRGGESGSWRAARRGRRGKEERGVRETEEKEAKCKPRERGRDERKEEGSLHSYIRVQKQQI